MPLPLEPDIDWYKAIEDILIKAHRLSNSDHPIILHFMHRPVMRVFITIGPSILDLPSPVTPGAYKTWRNWFAGFLQPLIKQMADKHKISIYVEDQHGNLLHLHENNPPEYYTTD